MDGRCASGGRGGVSNRMRSAFQLMEPERELLIAGHRFYVEEAKARLLSQFAAIEAEADEAAREHWDRAGEHFDPDWHDPGDLAEAARDYGIELYQLLSDMHDRTRLSVVAGMYHHWDKSLRRLLVREFRWPGLIIGDHTRRALWKLDSTKLERLMRAVGLNVRQFAGYPKIEAMRLVVNVFKHGEGRSLDDLSRHYPELLRDSSHRWGSLDDSDMVVTDEHVDEFSAAIDSFWRELPSSLTCENDAVLDVPDEFERAWRRDLANSRGARALT